MITVLCFSTLYQGFVSLKVSLCKDVSDRTISVSWHPISTYILYRFASFPFTSPLFNKHCQVPQLWNLRLKVPHFYSSPVYVHLHLLNHWFLTPHPPQEHHSGADKQLRSTNRLWRSRCCKLHTERYSLSPSSICLISAMNNSVTSAVSGGGGAGSK